MAQTIEEIAKILSLLQEENKINAVDVNRILKDIDSKVDYLNNNSDENTLLIDSIREAFESKNNSDIEKFSEFTNTLDQIKISLSSSVSSNDFDRFLDTVNSLEANFKQAVSGLNYDKQSFFDSIKDEIGRIIEKSIILKDLFPQKNEEELNEIAESINENIDSIKQDINNNVNTDFNIIQENIVSIINRIEKLKEEISENTSTNINYISNEMNSSVQKASVELAELKNILSKNFDDNSQILSALNDANYKISFIIEQSQKDFNENIISIKKSFDSLDFLFENLRNEIKQNSEENLNRIIESIKENSIQLKDFKENVSEHLTKYLTSIKDLFIAFSEDMKNNQNVLASDIFDKKLQELEIISKDINNFNSNIEVKEENYKTYISQKINELQLFINTIQENIKNNENEKFDELYKSLEEHNDIISNFSSNTDVKFGESISELTEIKDYIANTAIKLDDVQNNITSIVNTEFKKNEVFNDTIYNQFNNINTKLYSLSDELKQEFTNSNNSAEESKEEINSNINSNFNNMKTMLECLRANVSQTADNINVKIDEYNNTNTNIHNENQEIFIKLNNAAEEIISELKQNRTADNEKYVILAETFRSNIAKFEDLFSENNNKYSQEVAEKFNTIYEHICEIKEYFKEDNQEFTIDITNKFNTNLLDAKNEINTTIKQDFNSVAQSIGALLGKLESVKNDLTSNNATGHNNLEQSIIANLRTTESILTTNSEKYSKEVAEQITNINESIKNVKLDLENWLNENNTTSTTKLIGIEEKLNDISDNYKQNLETLQTKLGEYIISVDKISEDTNSKLDSSVNEFIDIRHELTKILEELETIKDNNSEELNTTIIEIINKLDIITDSINQSKDNIKNDVKEVLQENVDFIDQRLNSLSLSLNELKLKQSENFDFQTNNIAEKINSIKQEIELINTDITTAISIKSEELLKEFEPLQRALDKFLEFDFNEIVKEIKNQIELSYLDLLSELKDNLIENHDNYIRIENTYKEIVTKCSSFEDYINNFTKDNLELINSNITNIDLTVRANLEQTNYLVEEWHKNIDSLNEKLSKNQEFYKNSLSALLENIQNNLDDKLKAGATELKEYLNIILENQDTKSAIANLGGNISEKIEKYYSNINNTNENIQNTLTEIAEKINLSSNKDAEDLAYAIKNQAQIVTDSLKTLHQKIDIIAMDDNFEIYDEILDGIKNLNNKVDIIAIDNNTEEIQELSDEIRSVNSIIKNLHEKVDIIATADNSEGINEVQENISTINSAIKNLHEKIDIIAMADNSEGINEVQENISTISSAIKNLYEKVDIIAAADNSEKINELHQDISAINSTIKSLHEKIDILAMEDNSELQNELDEIYEFLKSQKRFIEEINEKIQLNIIKEKFDEVVSNIEKNNTETNKIAETLKILHEKVDSLALADNSEIKTEIKNIKDLIYEQRKLFDTNEESEKTKEIENYLDQLILEINKIEKGISEIDFNKNAQDIKDSVMTAILSVTDQISFVEETEEIKDFVEEKTDAINKTLLDVKKQLNNITNTSDDMDFYSYTLQDVESDIAKLRLILNDMSNSNSTTEFGVISANINRIVKSIEELRASINHKENFEVTPDFEKLNEDILSISARTNKLLLNSDESSRIICNSLDEFNRRTSNLENRINVLDNTNIEKHLSIIDEKVEETMNSNNVLRNVMMYLGEWMDGTSETISSIYEKTSRISSMQDVLDELKEIIPEKEILIKTIETKFEEQQNRIDRLEKKLDKAISIIEEQDENVIHNKIDKLENQLSKLSSNIEKLASYVDE